MKKLISLFVMTNFNGYQWNSGRNIHQQADSTIINIPSFTAEGISNTNKTHTGIYAPQGDFDFMQTSMYAF